MESANIDILLVLSKLLSRLLPLGLAFIMFSLGLTLRIADFARVFVNPRGILIGLFLQIVILPLAAFSLLQSWSVSSVLAVGIMILAGAPGGITSNLLTQLARGDTALSVMLTAISSLAGMVTVPFIVGFSISYFMPEKLVTDLPVSNLIIGVFLVSTLPVMIGLTINQIWPQRARQISHTAKPLSTGIFLLIVLGAFISSWQVMMENISVIGPFMLLLNALIMIAGWLMALGGGLSRPSATAIALEGGLQNGALGIFVALTLLRDETMMIPSITYALIMNITAAVMIFWRFKKASHRL
ncbi:MAG: bile acid:sodium symporter family protein [bacterium]|nr:bile acid:sodium symporter family protein [bacterium]